MKTIQEALIALGKVFKELHLAPTILEEVLAQNPWFTEDSIAYAFQNWAEALSEVDVNRWLSSYHLSNSNSKKVGLILAGNIPLVGFHDVLCTLISGHHALIKCASKDDILLRLITTKLLDIIPDWRNKITFLKDSRQKFDAVIATGSNNSSRYFEYYFRDIPHIIRKSRTSIAVLNGSESVETLDLLATDLFSYFGLGCRNVSHIFLPRSFDPRVLFKHFHAFEHLLINHKKYLNNYDYSKSIYLMNQLDFFDNGFVILKEDPSLKSPLACVFFSYYDSPSDVLTKVEAASDEIQCIISDQPLGDFPVIPLGQSQRPKLWDYADNIDTLKFLEL